LPIEVGSAAELWTKVRDFVADKSSKRAMISQLSALEYDGNKAVLGCPPLAASMMQSQTRALGELLQAVLGRPVQVQVRAVENMAPPVPMPAAAPPAGATVPGGSPGRAAAPPPIPPEVRDHPLVRKAIDLFGARITGVRQADAEALSSEASAAREG
jgi:hypothetical protein